MTITITPNSLLKTSKNQVCTNTECSLEHLLNAMNDKTSWQERDRERESGNFVLSTQLDYIYKYIYISIIIMSCRQHGYPWPSHATSPYCSSPLACLQGYIPYPYIAAVCMYVRAGRPAFAQPYVGVHRSTSLLSSSLLLQQCPACLARLTWIVFVMGGRWPYSWCFVECCLRVLFNIARSILV